MVSLVQSDADMRHCRWILHQCRRKMALARAVVEEYVLCNSNPYWAKRQWAISVLARERDFEDAHNMARKSQAEIAAAQVK